MELTPLHRNFLACNQPWEGMAQQPNGRLCGACNKVLVDFSTFSDTEIQRYHEQNAPGICGKYTSRQVQALAPRKAHSAARNGWLVAMFMGAMALSPLLTEAQDSTGLSLPIQLSPPLPGVPGDLQYPLLKKENPTRETIRITGRITDETGEGVIYAYISIEDTDITTTTDIDGYYTLELPASKLKKTITITATLLGYIKARLPYVKIEAPETVVDINMSVAAFDFVGIYIPMYHLNDTPPGQTTFQDPFNWGNGSRR